MNIDIEQDKISVTDLKRRTREIFEHAHDTCKPLVVTVNGRADVVLLCAKAYENLKRGAQVAQSFINSSHIAPHPLEHSKYQFDMLSRQGFRKFKDFWQEFRNVYKIDA